MRVCVFGLGHLGSVFAGCLASEGHEVTGLDPDPEIVEALGSGRPAFLEPGLPELLTDYRPRFTTDAVTALSTAEVLWLADDTPVDEDDRADVEWVLERADAVLSQTTAGTLVIVSSQLPVGSVAVLERAHPELLFACMPENLRLGRGVESFLDPTRIVVGTRGSADDRIEKLFGRLADRIIWMSIEAAEITKHALNAYLATSVAFANEIASICETNHADARQVELGMRSDPRIGEHAYVSAGPSFSGGTLARDLQYLRSLGTSGRRSTLLLDAVVRSNDEHSLWARHRLEDADPSVVAVWGLAYKPGTNSVRRSAAVELCRWLVGEGIDVRAHDPAAGALPDELDSKVIRLSHPIEAADGADALVVAVGWPEYRSVDAATVIAAMTRPLVIDAARVVSESLGRSSAVIYLTVGAPG